MGPSTLLRSAVLLLLAIGLCVGRDTDRTLPQRQVQSLSKGFKALRELVQGRKRFVGQLATDCGLDCKRTAQQDLQAKRMGDRIQQARKRFMSLGAADCGSFECVLRKRLAMEKVKRFLTAKDERTVDHGSVRSKPTTRRHKRYLDILLGNPYDQSSSSNSRPWENSYSQYGSQGWNDYYDNNYDDDYYEDYYDTSGSGYEYDDTEGSAYDDE